MVAKGLPDAEQRILADASKYIEEWEKVKRENKSIIASNKELADSFAKTEESIKKIERSVQDVAKQYERMEKQKEYIRSFNDMEKAVDAAHEANKRFNANPVEIQDHTDLIEEATKAYQDHAGMTDFLRRATTRYIEEVDRADDTHQQIIDSTNEMTAARQKAVDVTRELVDAHREMSDSLLAIKAIGVGGAAGAGGIALLNALSGGGGGGMDAAAMLAGMGGGGRGGSYRAMAAAAGEAPPDKGTAAGYWAPVANFMSTWLPRSHYILMAANEIAATVLPTLAAAGSAGLVAMQGFEQVVPRVHAVMTTAESLGPGLGITAGSYMGGGNALQKAQDLASGFAVQMLGAGVNIMKAGGGAGFLDLGRNTTGMVDRGVASLVQEFQGGLGKQLSGAASSGTDYMRMFGDIAGNIGHLFLNMAPNLPGVGGDYLSILKGATGGLVSMSGWLGPMLAPMLAGEAGWRLGTPLVGGIGSMLSRVGGGIAGLGDRFGGPGAIAGDLSAADAAAIAAEGGGNLVMAGKGGLLARLFGRGGVGLAGLGGTLGTLGAPEIAGAAASALLLAKGYTYQTPEQQFYASRAANINQMGIAQSYPHLIYAMNQAAAVSPLDNQGTSGLSNTLQGFGGIFGGIGRLKPGETWHGMVQAVHGLFQTVPAMFGAGMGHDPGNFTVAQQALQQWATSADNALQSGSQIQDQWKKLSGQAIDMGKATDVATMAQLQLGTAFDKNGQLTKQAQTMISNLYAGYAPMHMNAGMFGSAVAAQTAMSGLQHSQVSAVNQAYDQISQLVTGGAAGASNFFGLLGGTPTTLRRGGIQFAQAPAMSAISHALGSFISPTGAAAWQRLTNQQTGLFPALQNQTDWLRQAQVLQALSPGQTTGMASFEMAQLLPALKGSPAGLAMLSSYAQQFGGPAFAPGTSASAMFKSLSSFFARTGVSGRGFNNLMTLGTERISNLGMDANVFSQQLGQGIGGSMGAAVFSRGEDLMKAFMAVAGHRGTAAALGNLGNFMFGSGTGLQGAEAMVKVAATRSGASPQSINAMMGQLKKEYDIYIKTHADLSGAAAAKAGLAALKDKNVHAITLANNAGAKAAAAAMNAVHSKTVYIDVIENHVIISRAMTAATNPYPGGISGRMQTGGMVPGSGSGDIVPAMLEPGEAIVPRNLVPLISPILAAHRVPGFGGVPQSSASHFAAGGVVPNNIFPNIMLPQDISGSLGKNITWKLIDEIAKALNQADAKKIASALVNKITQEVGLAKNVASAAMAGQGFGTAGLLSNMDVTPGTGGGSVYEQMQSYLGSVKSFTKDIAALRKGHLNKALIAQLVAAGPVQGDALAQSIMHDYGGIKGVNSLWGQLGTATKGLGAQAAMAQYGGFIAPNLKSGSFSTNNISININAGGGATISLSTAQINALVAKIQAALLKQAKRNPKTGLQLSGKGA